MSKLTAAGWTHGTDLRAGIDRTYAWLEANFDHARGIDHELPAALSS